MINPETGIPQSYQELWISASADDVEQQDHSRNPGPAARDESAPSQQQHHPAESQLRRKVTVAFLHRPSPEHLPTKSGSEVQGMIIRVGNYCQGIIEVPPSSDSNAGAYDQRRAKDGFVRVERWRFQPTKDSSLPASGIGEIVEEEKTGSGEEAEDMESGKWIRNGWSDYKEDEAEGIWMPCLWMCEAKRKAGDWKEKDGFVGTWRVVEAEGW